MGMLRLTLNSSGLRGDPASPFSVYNQFWDGRPDIGMVVPSLGGGGVRRVFLNLAEGFVARGCRVQLFVCEPDAPFAEEVPPGVDVAGLDRRPPDRRSLVRLRPRLLVLRSDLAGVGTYLRPVLLSPQAFPELHYLPDIVRWLRKARPKVVISGVPEANAVTVWASRLVKPKPMVVVTEHQTLSLFNKMRSNSLMKVLNPRNWYKYLQSEILRVTYPYADAIVAVSDGVADDLATYAGLPRWRIRTIYNPIVGPGIEKLAEGVPDHAWFRSGEPPVILGAGRLKATKSFDVLIRAFSVVRSQISARLLILGANATLERDRKEREALLALARELGVSDDVALPGWFPTPSPTWRKQACSSSLRESKGSETCWWKRWRAAALSSARIARAAPGRSLETAPSACWSRSATWMVSPPRYSRR